MGGTVCPKWGWGLESPQDLSLGKRSPSVSWCCCNKIPQACLLKLQKSIFSHCWSLEVHDQASRKCGFWRGHVFWTRLPWGYHFPELVFLPCGFLLCPHMASSLCVWRKKEGDLCYVSLIQREEVLEDYSPLLMTGFNVSYLLPKACLQVQSP